MSWPTLLFDIVLWGAVIGIGFAMCREAVRR